MMRDRFRSARLLSFVTGLVNQELLLPNEYLAAENRILRAHLPTRLRLSDAERSTLAEIAKRLGRKALKEIARVAKPDTLLARVRVGDAGDLLQQFPAQLFADFCERGSLWTGQPEAWLQMGFQDAVLDQQVLILQEQFLVDETRMPEDGDAGDTWLQTPS
jgi:hypothetical protein